MEDKQNKNLVAFKINKLNNKDLKPPAPPPQEKTSKTEIERLYLMVPALSIYFLIQSLKY